MMCDGVNGVLVCHGTCVDRKVRMHPVLVGGAAGRPFIFTPVAKAGSTQWFGALTRMALDAKADALFVRSQARYASLARFDAGTYRPINVTAMQQFKDDLARRLCEMLGSGAAPPLELLSCRLGNEAGRVISASESQLRSLPRVIVLRNPLARYVSAYRDVRTTRRPSNWSFAYFARVHIFRGEGGDGNVHTRSQAMYGGLDVGVRYDYVWRLEDLPHTPEAETLGLFAAPHAYSSGYGGGHRGWSLSFAESLRSEHHNRHAHGSRGQDASWSADMLHAWRCSRPLEAELLSPIYAEEIAAATKRAGLDDETPPRDRSAAACKEFLARYSICSRHCAPLRRFQDLWTKS